MMNTFPVSPEAGAAMRSSVDDQSGQIPSSVGQAIKILSLHLGNNPLMKGPAQKPSPGSMSTTPDPGSWRDFPSGGPYQSDAQPDIPGGPTSQPGGGGPAMPRAGMPQPGGPGGQPPGQQPFRPHPLLLLLSHLFGSGGGAPGASSPQV